MSEIDLPTRILFRLQDRKLGQTTKQLSEYLKVPESIVRSVLAKLVASGAVNQTNGIWKVTLQTDAAK
jgi:hypothetical protein